jgi:hypothetical protein
MAFLANQEATLTPEPTELFRTRFRKCELKVTGIAGEFTTIPLQKKTRGALGDSGFFEGTEVELSQLETIPSAKILAKAPEGVGSLDIVYDVRTGRHVL